MLILSSNLHSICPTLRSLSSLKFIFVYGLRDVLVSFSFSLLMHIHALLHSGFHLFSFPATEVECSLFFMASGRFNLRRVLESNHSDWWYEVILNTLPWYLAMLATFHVIFFLMCELKVPVKIRFVAVYSVMNSFLMILHPPRPTRRLQEINCCLLGNPWTLWILNALQHGFLLMGRAMVLPVVLPETKLWWRKWRKWRPHSKDPVHALLHSLSLTLK